MKEFEIFTVSSLEKILPSLRPVLYEEENSCLKNETFSFQVAFRQSAKELLLQRCSWEVEGDLKAFILVRPVFPAPCTTAENADHDDYYLTETAALVPDILREDDFFSVRYKDWGALWITVRGDLPVGRHRIGILLKNGSGELLGRTSYTLDVIGAALPETDLKYAHWFHYDSLAEYYHLPVFGAAYNEVMKRFIANAVAHGVNMLLVPLFTPPLNTAYLKERSTVQLVDVFLEKGNYRFDFTRLKDFLQTAESLGVRYFEMSHLYTQWGATFAPKIMGRADGEYKRLFGWENEALGGEYAAFVEAFLPALTDFLRAQGYGAERCYFHISDEPGGGNLEHYRKIRRLVKPLLGEYKIFDALSNYDFYESGAVDVPVVSTDCARPFIDNNVEEWWAYYCCGQGNHWLSNRFMSMPLQRVRVLGLQLYAVGCKGFLHWGYNYYNSSLSEFYLDPYVTTDAGGSFQSGDGFIVYPAENGTPRDSIRHEAMYDAFQDYRALVLLERRAGRAAVLDFLKENGVEANFTEYPKSAMWHILLRRKINEWIRRTGAEGK